MKGDYMIDTLYTIVTDKTARDATVVEAQLVEQTSAGVPWFDEA